jgi:hypothetical protein
MVLATASEQAGGIDAQIFASSDPSVGLVIGTFAAVPYVHLHLESWRRFYPSIPILVHDDCSPNQAHLQALCEEYGADFVSSPRRGRWTVGDMASYVEGFSWAGSRGIELLVKMSRRFIPLYNWIPGLQSLAFESQYPTFSNECKHFSFGFRTECIGFHVESWLRAGALEEIRRPVLNDEPVFVEGYLHNLAREVLRRQGCAAKQEYVKANPRPEHADGYGVWEIMADKRVTRQPHILWHDCDQPVDYARVSAVYGLPYRLEDFNDPNQGFGLGHP